ncbi:lyr motif-containing 5 [Pyrrhoderma noxium]|uniref:Lyr motif-containing 5 n=1 Tax=Pyrrhoderma noxium TaxID=2282107 RepID=A0A286UJV7_9AGAM|nr:lyr motif-containing 5 [Pyrrhoderma noxium]
MMIPVTLYYESWGRKVPSYDELHRLGRDYPNPSYDFHVKLRRMYERNRNLTNPEDIERALQLAEFIRNETIALIKLSKYRHLRRAYPPIEDILNQDK